MCQKKEIRTERKITSAFFRCCFRIHGSLFFVFRSLAIWEVASWSGDPEWYWWFHIYVCVSTIFCLLEHFLAISFVFFFSVEGFCCCSCYCKIGTLTQFYRFPLRFSTFASSFIAKYIRTGIWTERKNTLHSSVVSEYWPFLSTYKQLSKC